MVVFVIFSAGLGTSVPFPFSLAVVERSQLAAARAAGILPLPIIGFSNGNGDGGKGGVTDGMGALVPGAILLGRVDCVEVVAVVRVVEDT
jgi:hypothetical protein